MILVAGGAGYIGSHVNKLLNQKGCETVVVDNLVYGHQDFVKWGHFFKADLADKGRLRECFTAFPIEAVFHFSAFAYVGESVTEPLRYYRNNVANTLNLLEVMKEFGVRYFVFSSTCATYGVPHTIPIPEEHTQNPINPYGRSKLMIEKVLADCDTAYGIKHVNLRYFNAAGADPDCQVGERHDPETHLIPLAIYAALGKRKSVQIFGTDYPTRDGTCIRDYIHVTDLADAHFKALVHLRHHNTSDAFNLGNGNGHSVREVIETVRQISNADFEVVETSPRPGDPPVLVGSSEKAGRVLNWKPQYDDIRVIVQTAWDWHKSDCK
ncbi:MAG: UDP-glucose 4-epimerase GalE [Planctomycetota bacterium]